MTLKIHDYTSCGSGKTLLFVFVLCVSQEMAYDLDDVLTWEYMLCGPRSRSLLALSDATGEEKEEQNDVRTASFPAFTHLLF